MRAFLIAITLYGCGTGNGGYEDYKKDALQVVCQFYARCGFYSPSRAGDCESHFSQIVSLTYSVDEALAAGRLGYDDAAGRSCLAAYAASTCDLLQLIATESCKHIYTPQVNIGGACKVSLECKSGFCAAGANPTDSGCPGTCAPFVATGADCAANTCAPSDTCDFTTHKCVALGQQGADCSTIACGSGLYCTNQTCQPAGSEGAACGQCASGLYCDQMVCKKRLPAGSPCTSSSACVAGTTCAGESLQMGTCQAFLDVGQSCGSSVEDSACAHDSRCDATSHTCTVQRVGDDCTSVGCGLELYCDSTHLCALKKANGETCDTSSACESGTCDLAGTKTCIVPVCK